jgi:hypothetical protein
MPSPAHELPNTAQKLHLPCRETLDTKPSSSMKTHDWFYKGRGSVSGS